MTEKQTEAEPYTVEVHVPLESVRSLISAHLQGSWRWVRFVAEIEPKGEAWRRLGAAWRLPFPMCEGGAYIFRDEEASRTLGDAQHGDTDENYTPLRLDLEAIKRGLKVMADKHPRHFADILSEKDDSTTADVFLQCCLLGDICYG